MHKNYQGRGATAPAFGLPNWVIKPPLPTPWIYYMYVPFSFSGRLPYPRVVGNHPA
jgi:hypothetical protein